jgi:mannose-6-phosphate isomerase-like protein (cupin superfamily)
MSDPHTTQTVATRGSRDSRDVPDAASSRADAGSVRHWQVVDFADILGTPCPCGTARRAFADVPEFPATVHITEISEDAQLHYHKTLTETYFFLECGPDAKMQLDDEIIDVKPRMCIRIPPGVRHRAIGKMTVLILVIPKFDPADEWLD